MVPTMRLLLPSLLLACSDKGGNNNNNNGGKSGPYTTITTQTVTTDSSGLADIEIDLESGESSFMVTGVAGSNSVLTSLEYITAPDGEEVVRWQDWYNSRESLTYAFFPAENSTVNWPVREEDGPLTDGSWTVTVGAYGASSYNYLGDEELEMTIHKKWDPDLTEGTVKAVILYADGLQDEKDLTNAVAYAVEEWANIWSQIGLTLEYRIVNTDLSTTLSDPSYGSAQLEEASTYAEDNEVVVLIGESLAGDMWTYGVSGNIPGALSVTQNSGVVISWLAAAGASGVFNDTTLDIFAETMAHEVGHYMGLFHPVEDGWEYWDALADTEQCSTGTTCYRDLGSNLMFPYPICSGNSCDRQNELTDDQGGVLNRYTGTL